MLFKFGLIVALAVGFAAAFRPMAPMRLQKGISSLRMMSDLVLSANPTIDEWLDVCEPGLKRATMSMFRSVKEIAYKLRSASCDKMACFNLFEDGESQPVDAVANDVIFQNLKACGSVAVASSEEVPTVTALGGKGYAVAFDPLDGDATSAVGSVWGIWPGDKLTGIKGKELKSAGVAVYGPRTTITLALDNLPGSHEFMLMDDYGPMHGQWVKCNEFTNVGEGKLMSPGNLRATQDNAGYKDLFSYYVQNQFALHHTGGLATDATQLLIKGRGVLCHAGSRAAPSSLRVLYEVAPIGFLIEKAGGRSTDGVKSVLEISIGATQQETQCAFGSMGEVQRFEQMVGTKYL